MCGICGCSSHEDHHHHHHEDHLHNDQLIHIERKVLEVNDRYANENREWFKRNNILAINILSSPGAGKTSLLIETIKILKDRYPIAVIEGDQQSDLDTRRIKALNIPAVQVNTGKGCHLDAHMVSHAVRELNVEKNSILFIENVGNLVCPALFDLGETKKIMLLSVPEGDDKPLKYPYIVKESSLMMINKCDLLPYVSFDVSACREYALSINPSLTIIESSLSSEAGLTSWFDWLNNLFEKQDQITA